MALASEAVLAALDHFIRAGGGSRGARAIRTADGEAVPMTPAGPLEAFRFRVEREAHRDEQIVVEFTDGAARVSTRPNRPFDAGARSFFERDWTDWRPGRIFDLESG